MACIVLFFFSTFNMVASRIAHRRIAVSPPRHIAVSPHRRRAVSPPHRRIAA
ncbi:MAG: hypothetical protein LBG47_02565 [Prevotellaceae bacterium]|jgi:hypothetical protein|nr:hypothetical protein [Prevotellaceae bacterium]